MKQAMSVPLENADALKVRGNSQRAAGDLEGAAATYRRALELAPHHAPVLYNLGLVLRELGRPEEAAQCFEAVLERDPRDLEALVHLATLLHDALRFEEAAALYSRALDRDRSNGFLWFSRGRCLAALGRHEEAISCYREALELGQGEAEAQHAMGKALLDLGRASEAVEHLRHAIRLGPELSGAHNDLGCALFIQGQVEDAAQCFLAAIGLEPRLATAHLNLANAYTLQSRHEDALESARRALDLDPAEPTYAAKMLLETTLVCDWSDFGRLCELVRRGAERRDRRPLAPFSLLSIPATGEEQLRCSQRASETFSRATSSDREKLAFRFHPQRKTSHKRLTIGYLSADFHEHATAYLAAELFELHDRSAVRVHAYSYGPDDGSPMRARLLRAFDHFADVTALSHAEAARAIHDDGVDILVDLKGYTLHGRTEILALRPAPIQVNYLGYPGTMGADFVDYLVGDRFVTPPESADLYAEKLVLMPGSYQVNDRRRSIAGTPSRVELGLPEDAFVFCCFNQAYKITPEVFGAWMRLLTALPRAVLWLIDWNSRCTSNLRTEAQVRGVDPRRLIFAPKLPLALHLGRLRAANLVLDTFPCNAHTTASDALWAGVPVLTRAGDTFASRVAGSLLCAAGLPELVTHSPVEYEARAMHIAAAPERSAVLRERLRSTRNEVSLFDTPRFVRDLERAYAGMWSLYSAGEAPRLIEL